jgi:hypothetical protein
MAEREARGQARMGGAGGGCEHRGGGTADAETADTGTANAGGGCGHSGRGRPGRESGRQEAGWRGHSGPLGLLQNREATEW